MMIILSNKIARKFQYLKFDLEIYTNFFQYLIFHCLNNILGFKILKYC